VTTYGLVAQRLGLELGSHLKERALEAGRRCLREKEAQGWRRDAECSLWGSVSGVETERLDERSPTRAAAWPARLRSGSWRRRWGR